MPPTCMRWLYACGKNLPANRVKKAIPGAPPCRCQLVRFRRRIYPVPGSVPQQTTLSNFHSYLRWARIPKPIRQVCGVLDCAGRAERRRRFSTREPSDSDFQSGVALRLPPQSKSWRQSVHPDMHSYRILKTPPTFIS